MIAELVRKRAALNEFLCDVQLRALRQAEMAVGDRDEALDIVQDCMVRLAKKYSEKEGEWAPIFQRILQNAIRDWYRRKKVRSIFVWWQQKESNESDSDGDSVIDMALNECRDDSAAPHKLVEADFTRTTIFDSVQGLPLRQQQAFMLRAWMEYSTEETATAMKCSAGSVKTHYSRAIKALQQQLVEL